MMKTLFAELIDVRRRPLETRTRAAWILFFRWRLVFFLFLNQQQPLEPEILSQCANMPKTSLPHINPNSENSMLSQAKTTLFKNHWQSVKHSNKNMLQYIFNKNINTNTSKNISKLKKTNMCDAVQIKPAKNSQKQTSSDAIKNNWTATCLSSPMAIKLCGLWLIIDFL